MRYRLITQPTVGPGKVTEELERLLKNAKRLTTSLVVVGPPHKRVPMMATVLEIPDPSAPMATRVLEIMLGPSGNCEPQKAITARAEWLKHALLVPQKGAQPLVEPLFEGWSSACLHVHWRPGRCVGVIHYSEGDAARVAALASHGWNARVLPAKVVDVLATVRLGISWVGRVSHQPFLGKPLVTPTAQSVGAVTSGGKSMTHASLFSGHQESVFQPDSTGGPKLAKLGQTRPTGIGTVLAPRGGDGFPLGTTLDGQAIKLAWHALLLAVVAPEDRQRDMVRTLVTRAIQHDLGLIAVIPQSLVSTRQLAAWSARVRVLDPRNMWESHAIPWHLVDPLLLREALAVAGVDTAPTLPLPTTFGEFLSTVPGGEQYCTESVLALTAPEGDDLRSVVDAGGGVLLVDDASPGGRLLNMLLFALLATNPQIDRRMLLIRSAQIPVPAALAQRSMQVVFGEDPAALGTLRAASDSWRLTHADGSPATDLDADLDRPSSALDETSYGTLMDTLIGEQPGRQTSALPEGLPVQSITGMTPGGMWPDDEVDLFATPFVTPAAPASDDELFTGALSLESPFSRSRTPVASTRNDDLFRFDSAPAAPAAPTPAPTPTAAADGNAFNSFFDITLDGGLDGAAAAPAADWTVSSSMADPGSVAPTDELGGEFALPDMRETDIGDPFTDFIGQPLDNLAASPPVPAADADAALGSSDVNNQPAEDSGDLGFDLFATPPDFGGIPATTPGDDAAWASGAGAAVLGTDSIFPSFTDELWQPLPAQPQEGNGALGLTGFSESLDQLPPEIDALGQPPSWDLPMMVDTGAGERVSLPLGADAAAADESAGEPTEAVHVLIIPEPGAGAPRARNPWLSDVPALTTTDLLDEVDTMAEAAREPISAALAATEAPEQVSVPTATSETPASARHVHSRRRRGWMPPRRVTIAAGAAEGSTAAAIALSELPRAGAEEDHAPGPLELPAAALPADDTVLPLDAVTLALTTGDLDLTTVPLFEGDDFALPPAAAGATGEPLADAAAVLTVSPIPGDVLLDFLSDPAEPLVGQPAAAEVFVPVEQAPTGAASLVLEVSPDVRDLPDLAALNRSVEQVPPFAAVDSLTSDATDVPDIHQPVEEAGAITVLIALAPAVEPAFPALTALPDMPTPQRASADLMFDADAVHAAWCSGTGMAELVDLVAGRNPGADRSIIRRTIRALLDARTVAGTAGSTLPTTPMWSVRAPSGSTARVDTAPAPLGPDVALDMAGETPRTPDLTLDTGGDPGTLEMAPADAAPIRNLPTVLPRVVATEQLLQLVVAPAAPDSAVARSSDDDGMISDDAVWARWSNDDELVEIIRAISGYTRGRAADAARDRVYRVVVPRIIVALDADMLVTRLIEGRKPLPSQAAQFDELLRRLNRQSGPVTGVIRDKTIARLLASMREVRAQIGVVA